jgi:Fur family transcriptional regulator, ferric uptake regulator
MNTTAAEIQPSDIDDLLLEHGYRMTSPRRRIVQSVLRRERPFTAEQLVAEMPQIGRATIYRTLEILASIDVLSRLLQTGGHPAYIVTTPGHRHHLVCSECGTVVSFTRCPFDEVMRDLGRDTDFAIHSHHLEVFGVCPECRHLPPMTASFAGA